MKMLSYLLWITIAAYVFPSSVTVWRLQGACMTADASPLDTPDDIQEVSSSGDHAAPSCCKDGYGLDYTLPMRPCRPVEARNQMGSRMVQTIPKLIPLSRFMHDTCGRESRIGIPRGHRICKVPECDSHPCIISLCKETMMSYECHCPPGTTGHNCNEDIDECVSSPCENGTCVDSINQFTCDCDAGWTGLNCSIDIDECASSPCVHGTCDNGINDFTCDCDVGWTGPNCTIAMKVVFTTDTRYRYRYSFPNVRAEKVQNLQVSFTVKASNDVHISLTPDRDSVAHYEIAIGSGDNTWSGIRRCHFCYSYGYAKHSPLNPTEPISFVVSYRGGRVSVFTGDDLDQPFMEYVDPNPMNVTQVGYSTGYGSTGEFVFDICTPNCY